MNTPNKHNTNRVVKKNIKNIFFMSNNKNFGTKRSINVVLSGDNGNLVNRKSKKKEINDDEDEEDDLKPKSKQKQRNQEDNSKYRKGNNEIIYEIENDRVKKETKLSPQQKKLDQKYHPWLYANYHSESFIKNCFHIIKSVHVPYYILAILLFVGWYYYLLRFKNVDVMGKYWNTPDNTGDIPSFLSVFFGISLVFSFWGTFLTNTRVL